MNSRSLVLSLSLLLGLSSVERATAVIGTVDAVPAATLLLPHFEVDLNESTGVNTLLSINNAASTAVLAHFIIWSDLSVPVLDFNIYLTGYDVQTISLRDILVLGVLPRTASAGQDPADTISPRGELSDDINFASCNGQLPPPIQPGTTNVNLPANFIDHLKRSLTGLASPVLGNLCAGRALGDNIARGYITVDTVNNCTLRFPGDVGYFGPDGDVTDQNVLWGSYTYVTPALNYARGARLVHIEASATSRDTSLPGQYTFYGRYVGWSARDHREPLVTNFAAEYVDGGAFTGGTQLLVWRDSKVNQAAFTCPATRGVRPLWFPLSQEQIVVFDEQEHAVLLEEILPFPAESQKTRVNGDDLPVPFNFGWLFLDLNTLVTAAGSNPPEDPRAAQAWVGLTETADGRFATGFDALPLDSATNAHHGLGPDPASRPAPGSTKGE